ncbi:MAG TPA: ABC transporter permease [Phycisphaerales bacterium]|nr:ABC transporter permease [Phycisphaerales bacterium]
MTQTLALFLDAYRELNSKKLFWITLTLSVLIVAGFAMVGLNDKGLTFLWWEFELPVLNTTFIPKELFYKFIFAQLGVPIWLTWVATILALVSTSSIFPDFLASGSIELTLSKPISRVRLFLTKFATGLLFVGLQVFVFSFACFLLIGIRGGAWEWRLFLAVPVVLLFFSYLFSIQSFFGLVTRSTIASLLLTLLIWFALFALNTTENIFLSQREAAALTLERTTKRLERAEKVAKDMLEKKKAAGESVLADGKLPEGADDELEAVSMPLRIVRDSQRDAEKSARDWRSYHTYAFAAKTLLPKTSETIGLLDRYVINEEDRQILRRFQDETDDRRRRGDDERARMGDPDVTRRTEDVMLTRSTTWVLGTSIVFTCLVLGVSCIIFTRRDF